MTSNRAGLRHNAFVYESQDEYVARAVRFLKERLECDEGAIVAHTKPGIAFRRVAHEGASPRGSGSRGFGLAYRQVCLLRSCGGQTERSVR